MEIEKFALELESALNNWRIKPEKGEKILVETINRIACAFNVIGGAFGIANMETNSFELWRYYPNNNKEKNYDLFPYLYPPKSPISEKLALHLNVNNIEDGDKLAKVYSNWLHNLFQIQREEQRIDDAPATVLVPEFYRKIDETPFTYINFIDIIVKLKTWLDIWRYAAASKNGLSTTSEHARSPYNKKKYEETLDKSLLEIIQLGLDKFRKTQYQESSYLPEHFFFLEKAQNEIQSFFGSLTVKEVFDELEKKSSVSINKDFNDSSNTYLINEILLLHNDSFFPVIPYLLLSIIDSRKFGHCVIPVLHSPQFPIEYTMPEKEGQNKLAPKKSTCGMVFLGTVEETDNIKENIGMIKLFMQFASAPLADTIFYGGYQRRKLKFQTYNDTFNKISHELSHLQSFLTKNFLIKLTKTISSESNQFGKFEQDAEQLERTKDWLLIIAPKIYESVANKFTLWIGKGWLNRADLDLKMPLVEALYKLVNIIVSSHVAKSFSRENVVCASFKYNIDELFLERSETLFNKIKSVISCDPLLYWIPFENEDANIGFSRLLSASISNALEKTEDIKSIIFECKNGYISFMMENHAIEPGKEREDGDGTKGVIYYLVQIYGGDINKVTFKHEPQNNVWKTGFSIPAKFISLDN